MADGVTEMDTQTPQLDLLIDLDARHEELLRQLEELDKRVEKALVECQAFRSRPLDNTQSSSIGCAPRDGMTSMVTIHAGLSPANS